jgi:hypothetical protein
MNEIKLTGEAYPWRPDRTEPELREHAAAVARRKKVRVRLWLPLTPLFILLAPFALIAAPLIDFYPPARGVSPWRAAWVVGAVLLSTHGTVVEIDSPEALVHIRIF